MKRLLVALALLTLAACGKDDNPDVAAATTTTTAAPVLVTTTTAAPKATTTTAKAGDPPGLIPADSQTPAAGSCSNSNNGIAEVVLNPDVPSPRCIIVKDTDHLRVENNFDVEVSVYDNSGQGAMFTLKPGASDTGMKAIGGYWATGVHRLKITNTATKAVLYGGSGPEVWLK
jgi:hypothetical protein